MRFALRWAKESITGTERFDFAIFLPIFRLLPAKGLYLQGDQEAAREILAIAETNARTIGSKRSLWVILAQQAKWETKEEAATALKAEAWTLMTYIDVPTDGNCAPSIITSAPGSIFQSLP